MKQKNFKKGRPKLQSESFFFAKIDETKTGLAIAARLLKNISCLELRKCFLNNKNLNI